MLGNMPLTKEEEIRFLPLINKMTEIEGDEIEDIVVEENLTMGAEGENHEERNDFIQPRSNMTVSEYKSISERLFTRYDFDESGTLNDIEELRQLSLNLCFQLSSEPHLLTVITTDEVEAACNNTNCGALNDENSDWSLLEFQHWFADTILGNKL